MEWKGCWWLAPALYGQWGFAADRIALRPAGATNLELSADHELKWCVDGKRGQGNRRHPCIARRAWEVRLRKGIP